MYLAGGVFQDHCRIEGPWLKRSRAKKSRQREGEGLDCIVEGVYLLDDPKRKDRDALNECRFPQARKAMAVKG